MFLNYGHTIGRQLKVRSPLKMEHYRHGEKVALGMLCVSFIGEKYFNVKNLFYDHIKILKKFRLPQKIKNNKSKEQILNIILKNIIKDKKKSYGC